MPGVESDNLDEEHVIADSLGEISNAYNITPQNSTLIDTGIKHIWKSLFVTPVVVRIL